jgi:hypothetical protein
MYDLELIYWRRQFDFSFEPNHALELHGARFNGAFTASAKLTGAAESVCSAGVSARHVRQSATLKRESSALARSQMQLVGSSHGEKESERFAQQRDARAARVKRATFPRFVDCR